MFRGFRLAAWRPLAVGAGAVAWTQPPHQQWRRDSAPCIMPQPSPFPSGPHARYTECQAASRSRRKATNDVEVGAFFDRAIDLCGRVEQWGATTAMTTSKGALLTAKQDLDREPMIMVVGAFSAGKSTLINSLVGKQVCATGVEPTTCDLHFIAWRGFSLVDSSGLDAMNQPEHKEKALEAARRSNVAIVVLNARQPLRESEGPILSELMEANSQVVVALNYWNQLDEKERSQSLSYVQRKLGELMPGKQIPIVPINAKCRQDPGLQKLCEKLLCSAGEGSHQKVSSAKAAMERELRNMLEQGKTLAASKEASHREICEKLDSQISTWKMHDQHAKALEEQLLLQEEALVKLQDKKREVDGGFWGSVSSGVAAGMATDAATGGATCGLGTVLGLLGGVCSGLAGEARSEETRNQMDSQIQKKEKHIDNLRNRIDRTDAEAEIRGLQRKLQDEKNGYQAVRARVDRDMRDINSLLQDLKHMPA